MSDHPPNISSNPRGWALGLVWVIVSGLVVGWFGHVSASLRDHDQRIPRAEQRLSDQSETLKRLEQKIDKLLERQGRGAE